MTLYDLITALESTGAFDIALPFLLIFTITFAVLQKIQLFGQGKKNIDLIISLVLSFLTIRNVFITELINRFLPNVAMFLIIILMFLLILGTFGGQTPSYGNFMGIVAFLVSLFFVITALSSDIGYGFVLPYYITDFFDYQTKAMILFVGGIVAVVYFATSTEKPKIWETLKEVGNELIGKGNK